MIKKEQKIRNINKKELVHNEREEKNECIIELKREN